MYLYLGIYHNQIQCFFLFQFQLPITMQSLIFLFLLTHHFFNYCLI
jgi:hypothetical protein